MILFVLSASLWFNILCIGLSISDSRNDVYAALDAGANGYLLKECELDMLLLSLRKAVVGRPVYSEKFGNISN